MPRIASVLTLKEKKSKSIAFKITEQLDARLEALDQRLAAEAPESEFDRAAICTAALEDAVEQANAELDKLKKSKTA